MNYDQTVNCNRVFVLNCDDTSIKPLGSLLCNRLLWLSKGLLSFSLSLCSLLVRHNYKCMYADVHAQGLLNFRVSMISAQRELTILLQEI